MPDETDEIERLAKHIETDQNLESLPDLRAVILASPSIRRLYVAAAVRCLGARRFMFDKKAGELHFEPDGSTIMRAVAFLASYDAGLPAQTTINLNLGKDKDLTPAEVLAQSPALVASMERTLAAARKAAPRPQKRVAQVQDTEEAP